MTTRTLLDIHALDIVRSGITLAQNITLALEEGGILLLTGPNGSGKTSLLRAIAGLLDSQSGTVTKNASIHFLAAQHLNPSLETPRQYLAYQSALLGTTFALTHDPFGIAGKLDTPLNKLSTGWRQRVKLSRLACADRTLWLLDEPSDGLDVAGVAALQALVKTRLQTGGGVIIATHDPHDWPDAKTFGMTVSA